MEEDFAIEAYYAADEPNDQVSDQRVLLPHPRLRAVFNNLSSTHSSPTEVRPHFESHEGPDCLALQRVASQRIARGSKRPALSTKNDSAPKALKVKTKTKGEVVTVSNAGKYQAKPQQTKNMKSSEALTKRLTRVPYLESDSSDSEQEEQEEVPVTEMDAIKEASSFVSGLSYTVNSSCLRY